MANESNVKYNMDGLDNIIKSLKNDYVLRVGILGSNAKNKHDKDSGLTNAEIGTFHEFGTSKMPRRSFLEDSLKFRLQFNSEQFKQLRKVLFKQFFIKNAPQKFLQDLGAKCLEIIEEGFATNGFGMWKPLSAEAEQAHYKKARFNPKNPTPASLERLHKTNILTLTGKLRRSISFKVMKRQ